MLWPHEQRTGIGIGMDIGMGIGMGMDVGKGNDVTWT